MCLVFVTFIFFAVRYELRHYIQMTVEMFHLRSAMAQSVSRQFFYAEVRFQFQATARESFVGKGTGFSPSTSVFPCPYHSTIALYHLIYMLLLAE